MTLTKPDDVLTNERLELFAVRFQFRAGEIWRVSKKAPAERYGAPSGTGFIWTDVTSGVWLCDVGDELEAIALAQSDGSSGMVKVKPLTWRVPTDHPKDHDREDNVYCADGVGGVYAISRKQKHGPERLLWMADDPMEWRGFDSIDAAKAAAQADFETRVRSCLAIQPVSGDGNDYVVWSNEHRCWWGPNNCGYTKSLLKAGRYSRQDALGIAKGSRNGWSPEGNPDEIAVPLRDAEFCLPTTPGVTS